jgi:hypothetical protein
LKVLIPGNRRNLQLLDFTTNIDNCEEVDVVFQGSSNFAGKMQIGTIHAGDFKASWELILNHFPYYTAARFL